MKTAIIPAVRIEPGFRDQLEQVLGEHETLSQFVEAAVRASLRQRLAQAEFVRRGLRSLAAAEKTGDYIEADEAVGRLKKRLAVR